MRNDDSPSLSGYLSRQYASSFEEFGEPLQLPRSGAWILLRKIPGTELQDAMGLYPLLFCRDWSALKTDIQELQDQIVSFSAVTDPVAELPLEAWGSWAYILRPYKTHYLAEFSEPVQRLVSKSNRRRARRALDTLRVDILEGDSSANLESWLQLYDELIERHKIKGIRRFSKNALERQLSVPGIVYVRAMVEQCCVGANIVYLHDKVSYGHLSAFSKAGYETGAPSAIKWTLFHYLNDRVRVHSLGSGAGIQGAEDDGLVQFKKSWTNSTRLAYFLGVVLNPKAYVELEAMCTRRRSGVMEFFPAYRSAE